MIRTRRVWDKFQGRQKVGAAIGNRERMRRPRLLLHLCNGVGKWVSFRFRSISVALVNSIAKSGLATTGGGKGMPIGKARRALREPAWGDEPGECANGVFQGFTVRGRHEQEDKKKPPEHRWNHSKDGRMDKRRALNASRRG
ncbi:MAG: hypothetical protein IANPNBLG_00147 [Bryobacteraceae bacterium]|nr:hypothetical protein [Bryobacteraceae bacterium]